MAVVFKKKMNTSLDSSHSFKGIELSEGLYKRKETEEERGEEDDTLTSYSDSDIEIKDDKAQLISDKEETVGQSLKQSAGVYNDYEEVLKTIGFGLSQILMLLGISFVNGADAVEVLGIGYILQFLRLPSEFGMTPWQSGLLSATVFIGMLIGGYVWGGLADITGRRMTLIVSLFVNSLFAAVSSLSPNYYFMLVFRFISGVGIGGSLPVAGPYLSEFVYSRYRGSFLGIYGVSWISGAVVCTCLAWLILPQEDIGLNIGSISIHSWRVFILLCSLPSFVGAILCIFMPESPRYLLEVKKEQRAIKILRNMFRLNNFMKKKHFPIKSIQLHTLSIGKRNESNYLKVICNFHKDFLEILFRTLSLFRKKYVRSTILMMIAFYSLSFGSYGVTLWFPSYIDRLSRGTQTTPTFSESCNNTLENEMILNSSNFYCSCPQTDYYNVTMVTKTVDKWWAWQGIMNESLINSGRYQKVWLKEVTWSNVVIKDVIFDKLIIYNSSWSNIELINVTIFQYFVCQVSFHSVLINRKDANNFFNQSCANSTHYLNSPPTCLNEAEPFNYNEEYFNDFIITSSGFIGNVVSAIAVYFFIRSFWLAFSLGISSLSVFLLYIINNELGAVILLCVFKAITQPSWSTTNVLIVDLYPTAMRTTSSGLFLVAARIGAIMGTYIFGLFSGSSDVSFPILLTVSVLSVGTVVSLFLPWTTRKTPLK